jgi:hypothetical protein
MNSELNDIFEKYLENSVASKSKLIETLIKNHLISEKIINK